MKMNRNQRELLSNILGLVGIVLGVFAIIWFVQFMFLDVEHHQALVTADENGIYKTWSISKSYETYRSDTDCTTDDDGDIDCDTDYWWESYEIVHASGTYKIDPIRYPESQPFKRCTTLLANRGCQREVVIQRYSVRLQITDKNRQVLWCDVPYHRWSDGFTIESLWWINRNRAWGFMCNTLQEVR